MEALLFARADARKWRRHFPRSRTNLSQALRERHSTLRLRAPVQLLMTYTRLEVRFSRLSQEPKASVLLRACAHPELPPPLTCALPELPPLILFRMNSASCVPHTDLVHAFCRSLVLSSGKSPTMRNQPSSQSRLYLLPPGHGLFARNPWKVGPPPARHACL